MKRAYLYLRVSSAGQTKRAESSEGYSITAQREACLRRAAELEAEVAGEYVDAAESARSADRPQLQRMLADLAAADGRVAYVIVHKVDRLARSRADDVLLTLKIREAGARLVSVTESIDETPTGLLLHGIMASVAEFYSRNLATEIDKGRLQKAKLGGTPSRAPLGYLNFREWVEGRDIRSVKIDPERGEHMRWAFAAYATGEWSIRDLAEELHERGLRSRPTPTRPAGKVRRSVLAELLHNPYYVGVVRFKGAEYEGHHPKLIAPELFERCQEVSEARQLSGEKRRLHEHYLKGTLHCVHCHRRLLYTKAKGRGGVYWYFMCAGRHQGSKCPQPYIPADAAEAAVARYWGQTVRLRADRISDAGSSPRAFGCSASTVPAKPSATERRSRRSAPSSESSSTPTSTERCPATCCARSSSACAPSWPPPRRRSPRPQSPPRTSPRDSTWPSGSPPTPRPPTASPTIRHSRRWNQAFSPKALSSEKPKSPAPSWPTLRRPPDRGPGRRSRKVRDPRGARARRGFD